MYTIVTAEALDPATAQLFPHTARFAGNLFLIASVGRGAVGVAAYRQVCPGEAELLFIETKPNWRRRGVASALLRDLLRRCPGDVFLEVRESNHAALALYGSIGFREEGVRRKYYSDPVESAIVMKFHS